MAFENLTSRFQMAFRRLVGKARLNENDIEEMLREIRLSLLEADVNYKVVKEFTDEIKTLAFGEKILKGLNPDQQVVKIVNDELVKLMGSETSDINFRTGEPTVIMMVGLQGTGKTTTAGKLANLLRKTKERKPLLVAADIYRPAAIEQLQTVGKQLDIPVFSLGDKKDPVEIASEAMKEAKASGYDLVIIDTAGRLHVNETLMDELEAIKKKTKPDEILLT
ncbi:MAG TPA: signal recognition particle receptor subunit alpha, partial [Bacillota bacterium]|nr:signal recognition particle receptor subunit alpha [Bacillota bacterium]HPJ86477.1 signal recognition particle receptor subunit alpha [Bacillota bacterium]HRX92265.1 signal recognition particle receptor subunit alpha [Candidatus Izemoplasmatales bacterium]